VAFGGTLYQDIETQVPGSQLHRARVNSIHHQGIKDVAPEFDVEAWSIPDHIPEAIFRKPGTLKSYIAATQWHPEFQFRNPDTSTLDDSVLLRDFLAACSRARVSPAVSHSPFQIRNRAARLLRRALLRRH
jgi:putative glutamine amidotransferase